MEFASSHPRFSRLFPSGKVYLAICVIDRALEPFSPRHHLGIPMPSHGFPLFPSACLSQLILRSSWPSVLLETLYLLGSFKETAITTKLRPRYFSFISGSLSSLASYLIPSRQRKENRIPNFLIPLPISLSYLPSATRGSSGGPPFGNVIIRHGETGGLRPGQGQ